MSGRKFNLCVDGFNFSVGKSEGKYDLKLKVNLSFKPKEPADEPL